MNAKTSWYIVFDKSDEEREDNGHVMGPYLTKDDADKSAVMVRKWDGVKNLKVVQGNPS